MTRVNPAELLLAAQLDRKEFPKFEREVKFHPERKWKFDIAFTDEHIKLAVEIEGGIWTKSRHTTGKGFTNDIEKYAEAAILGWTVLRVTTDMVNDGRALELIRRYLQAREVIA
jgi:very-short-patch-repair endonuclease